MRLKLNQFAISAGAAAAAAADKSAKSNDRSRRIIIK